MSKQVPSVLSAANDLVETHRTLLNYVVSLYENAGDKFKISFACMAEDADHAEEQAESAYPNCEVCMSTLMGTTI